MNHSKARGNTVTYMLVFTFMIISNFAFAWPHDGLKKGYITNNMGGKCWYKHVVKENMTYFHARIKGTDGILTFDIPTCMSDGGLGGLGREINIGMINVIISRWYSHSDANFQTEPSELYNGSLMQKKGKCIQSETYPSIGITVDYSIENDSIIEVIHGPSIQGCTN